MNGAERIAKLEKRVEDLERIIKQVSTFDATEGKHVVVLPNLDSDSRFTNQDGKVSA